MSRPIDAHTVLSSSAYLTPREKMMLAKMAIIEDEDRERDERRERRRTRRASSIARGMGGLDRPTSPSSISSSISSSSRRTKPPSSIIRPKYPITSIKAKSWAQPEEKPYIPLPAPMPFDPSAPLSPKSSRPPSPPKAIRRRSSKVRFIDSASNPSTLASIPDESESPRGSVSARGSVSYRVPVPRLSAASGQTDPFELQTIEMKSRPSFAVSVTSEEDSGVDAFAPKPLSYPKVSKALARLSAEMEGEPSRRDSLTTRSVSAPAGALPQVSRTSSSTLSAPATSSRPSYASSGVSDTVASNSSSISLFIPNRAEILNHLLPQSSPMVKQTSPVPEINRSGWMDGDAGISPKSSPIPLPTVVPEITSPRPSRSDSSGPLEVSPKSVPVAQFKMELNPNEKPPVSLASSIPTPSKPHPVKTPPPRPKRSPSRSAPDRPKIDHNEYIDLMPPSVRFPETSPHARVESEAYVAVMDFPVPPERTETLQYAMVSPHGKDTFMPASGFPRVPPEAPSDDVFEEDESEEEKPEGVEKNYDISTPAYESTDVPEEAKTPEHEIRFCDSPIEDDFSQASSSTMIERPASPPLSAMIKKMSTRKLVVEDDSDSDIDLSAPLMEVALKSKILSPNSRLLNTESRIPKRSAVGSLRRQNSSLSSLSLRTGRVLTSGKGWSGSESEEEAWSMTVKSVLQRRVSSAMSSTSSKVSTVESRASIVQVDSQPVVEKAQALPPPARKLRSIPAPKKTLLRAARIDSLHLSATPLRKPETEAPPLPLPPRPIADRNPSSRLSTGSDELVTPQDIRNIVSPTIHISHEDRRASSSSSNGSAPGAFPWGRSGPASPAGSVRSIRLSPKVVEERLGSPTLLPLTPSSLSASPKSTVAMSVSPPTNRRLSRMPAPARVDEWGAIEELHGAEDKYTRYEKPNTVGQARSSFHAARPAYSSSTWTPVSSTYTDSPPPSPSRAACSYVPTSKKATSPRKPVPAFSMDAAIAAGSLIDLTPKLGHGWRVPSPLFGYEGRYGGGADNDYILEPSLLRA